MTRNDIIEIHLPTVNSLNNNPVTQENRKLKARWTMEAEQDFRAFHNADMDNRLFGFLDDPEWQKKHWPKKKPKKLKPVLRSLDDDWMA